MYTHWAFTHQPSECVCKLINHSPINSLNVHIFILSIYASTLWMCMNTYWASPINPMNVYTCICMYILSIHPSTVWMCIKSYTYWTFIHQSSEFACIYWAFTHQTSELTVRQPVDKKSPTRGGDLVVCEKLLSQPVDCRIRHQSQSVLPKSFYIFRAIWSRSEPLAPIESCPTS